MAKKKKSKSFDFKFKTMCTRIKISKEAIDPEKAVIALQVMFIKFLKASEGIEKNDG